MCCSGEEESLLLSHKIELPTLVWTFFEAVTYLPPWLRTRCDRPPSSIEQGRLRCPHQESNAPILI
jgi:hypothetical protein